MFTGIKYRSKCTELITLVASNAGIKADWQHYVEFVEDYKDLFDEIRRKGKDPEDAVIFATYTILLALDNGNLSELKSFNNCKVEESILLMLAPLCVKFFDEVGNQEAAEEIRRISSGMTDAINEVVSLAEGMMTKDQLKKWQSVPDKAIPTGESEAEEEKEEEEEEEEEEEGKEWMSEDSFRVICSPKQAYFNRNLAVYYSAKVGEEIPIDSPVLRLADKDGSIVIKASRNSIIKQIITPHGTEIKSSNLELCRIWETNAEFHQDDEKDFFEFEEISKNQALEVVKNDEPTIEEKLKELKKLYTKKLISKSIYEDKQREIMSSF